MDLSYFHALGDIFHMAVYFPCTSVFAGSAVGHKSALALDTSTPTSDICMNSWVNVASIIIIR